jgi:hypothetical protein
MFRNFLLITLLLVSNSFAQITVLPGGGSGGGIADGTATDNTARWNGSAWVESSAFTNDNTNIVTTGGFTFSNNIRSSTGEIRFHTSNTTEVLRMSPFSTLLFNGLLQAPNGVLSLQSANGGVGASNSGILLQLTSPANDSTNHWLTEFQYESNGSDDRVVGIRADGHTVIGPIGSVFPTTRLHVFQETAVLDTVIDVLTLDLATDGTAEAGLGVGMNFTLEDDSGNKEITAAIRSEWEDPAAADETANMIFYTKRDAVPIAEAMRITALGRLGINTNSPDSPLSVSGAASKTGGGLWSVISDIRIKKDIKPYDMGLKELVKVEPVRFRYKDTYLTNSKEYVGIIAQQMRRHFPGTIDIYNDSKGKTGYRNLLRYNGSELTYALINAVKELNERVIELENEMKTYK